MQDLTGDREPVSSWTRGPQRARARRSTDLRLVSQHHLQRLVFAVAQEAVCVEAVVAAIEPEEHRVARRLRAVESAGDEADLRGGSTQVEGAGGGQGLVEGAGGGVCVQSYTDINQNVFIVTFFFRNVKKATANNKQRVLLPGPV